MAKSAESFKLPLVYSIGIHAAIAAVLLVSFEFTSPEPTPMQVNLDQSEMNPQPEEIVNAVSVDKAAVERQVQRIKD